MSGRQRGPNYSSHEPSTSELRHDWLSDRWVIIAPQRTERPDDFARACDPVHRALHNVAEPSQADCPFCRGHESQTPPPLAVYSSEGPLSPSDARSGQWLVRVVPNKFPAVNGVQSMKFGSMVSVDSVSSMLHAGPDARGDVHVDTHSHSLPDEASPTTAIGEPLNDPMEPRSDGASDLNGGIDLFHTRHVSGAHEVIIESPFHLCSLTELDRGAAKLIFRAYRDRLQYWRNCIDIAYSVVFKNVGLDAGASLVHTHSQLIATNMLPTDVKRTIGRMEMFYQTEHDCLFCRMLRDELDENVRIVAQTSDFVAFCPFASRLPSLVTILPRDHESCFEDIDDERLEQLAWLVHRMLGSIEICYPQAAYNYVLHTAPKAYRSSSAFHWRVELFPRLTRVAGFEWGSDCFINPLPPELAAQRLRTQRAS